MSFSPLAALRAARWRVRAGALSEGQREVLGWGLLAAGVFLAFVLYGGWDGGGVGHALAVALGFTVGRARWLVPLALIAAAGAALLRPALAAESGEALRPLRGGALCLAAAVLLALAAGTLGVSPGSGAATAGAHAPGVAGHGAGGGRWSAAYLEDRGGILGEALWWAAHALVQDIGVDLLVAFLALAGISLLSGASVPALLRGARTLAGAGAAGARLLAGSAARAHATRPPAGGIAPQSEPAGLGAEWPPGEGADAWLDAGPITGRRLRGGGRARASGEDAGESERAADAQDEQELLAALFGDGASAAAEEGSALAPEPPAGDEEARSAEDAGAAGAGGHEPDAPRALLRDAYGEVRGAGAGGHPEAEALTPQGRLRKVITDDPSFVWKLPQATGMLSRSSPADADGRQADTGQQERVAAVLVEALGHFGVQAEVIGTVSGPHITRYELRLAPGIKVAKVAQLKDDLAYALAATDIRIQAPIPGKQAVGVEVPNARRRIVRLGDVLGPPPRGSSPLIVWLGKDVAGKAVGADLAKMPHLLVAGATGSGKSGAINAMLSSVLLRATPHEVRLVLVDPKQVELNHYESIPHLLTPVITNPRMAANALANLVREMESRYGIMSLARTRSLPELNAHRQRRGEPPLPYILCVIDELADLMMVAPADVEDSIIRLAQKARAVGIHLVLATQSPRVDVITGMIKANVPSRIAFAVSSQTDSRVILDQNGAETLLGQGDMLFSPMGSSRLQRIQGAYIDEPQIAKITEHWRVQGEPELREELLEQVEPDEEVEGTGSDDGDPDSDPLLRDAITLVAEMQTASTSMMQRRLRVGYTRAGRLIDMLERRGVISGYEGSKPRQVLISEADLPRVLQSLGEGPAATPAADAGAGGVPAPATGEGAGGSGERDGDGAEEHPIGSTGATP